MTTRIATFLLTATLLTAQPAKRPKIGLVLEGGGALGFAHIGVLKWFEDHHIPVDYVAGTSMGGLIGGLYATGQRPEEIRALARDTDWPKTLSGVPALQDLDYRRKEDRLDFPNRLAFGLKKKTLSAPGGLNGGQEIGFIFDRLALPYFDLRSFDDLPIPFRCVATEMVSGKQVVFDNGSLAFALRSTMSIPAVFSPVKDGDKIYTDGGALNNMPVDVAKAMGADIIIAVYLDQGASDPNTFNSLLGSVGRYISIMVASNEIKSMQDADILLSADLKGFAALDFAKSEEIFPKGVEAASKKANVLARLALNETDWTAHLEARNARRRTRVPEPAFISVDGTRNEMKATLEAKLAPQIGQPIEPGKIENDLRKLAGVGYFDSLGYNIASRNGTEGLQIRAIEKSYGPPFLDLGVNIDGTDTNDIRFGLSARVTIMDLGGYRSELRLEGAFGVQNSARIEYFHPFSKSSRWFIAPRAYVVNRGFDIYANQLRISQFRVRDSGFAADLGYSISHRAEVRFGEALDWQGGKLVIGQAIVPNSTNRRGISSAQFRYYGEDDVVIPRRGLQLQADYNFFTRGRYSTATTRAGYFLPISPKASVFAQAAGGSAFGARGLGPDSFALGGPLLLGAYGRNELLGNQFYLMQAGYLRELFKMNPLIGDALYGVAFYEVGKVYAPLLPGTPRNPMDASAAVVLKTAFGPVFFGGSVGESWRRKWYFGLGRVF